MSAAKWRGGDFGHGWLPVTADGRAPAFGNGRLALLDASPADNK